MDSRTGQLERGELVAGYRVDDVISRGGMGVVYRVTNVALHRIYALKTLTPELSGDVLFRERFRREMRIAASLRHPNVVGIHYAGEHGDLLFLVMDFIYGSDLNHLLRETGALDPERAVDLLAQFASALDAAHRKGLVHRDVKPGNMLITVADGEEHGYLTDFGVAKRSDNIDALTATGAVVGTVHYMAPEQISGERADARTDIYALGCVFFQMLTGRVPYERENSIATLFAHIHEPVPKLPEQLADLYPTFGPVIEKAMAKNPDDRHLSAGDFARDAACALSGNRYAGSATLVAVGDARPGGEGDPAAHTDVPAATTDPPAIASPPATTDVPATAGPPATPGPPATAFPEPEQEPAAATAGVSPPTGPAPAQPAQPVVVAASEGPKPGGLKPPRRRWLALAGAVLLAGVIAAVVVLSAGGSSKPAAGQGFAAALRPVPTNRVTGTGRATVAVRNDVATVTVDTNGLLNAAHLMHIHGGTGNCPTASAAQRHNGNAFIPASVGDKFYGPVVQSLTQVGDTGPQNHLSFTLYPASGNIRYQRTFDLAHGTATDIRSGLAVIVVHGIDYDGGRTYDNFLGPGIEANAPALCGPLFPSQNATTAGVGGSTSTYVAALTLRGPTPTQQSLSSVFLCHPTATQGSVSPTAADRAPAAPT